MTLLPNQEVPRIINNFYVERTTDPGDYLFGLGTSQSTLWFETVTERHLEICSVKSQRLEILRHKIETLLRKRPVECFIDTPPTLRFNFPIIVRDLYLITTILLFQFVNKSVSWFAYKEESADEVQIDVEKTFGVEEWHSSFCYINHYVKWRYGFPSSLVKFFLLHRTISYRPFVVVYLTVKLGLVKQLVFRLVVVRVYPLDISNRFPVWTIRLRR